jgi:hypothetical protein
MQSKNVFRRLLNDASHQTIPIKKEIENELSDHRLKPKRNPFLHL